MGYFVVNIGIHHMCIDSVRNGMYMMRQVIFNPLEFSHPRSAFLLGMSNFALYLVIETINISSSLGKLKAELIIQKFVSYAILLQIPQIYMRQRKMFNLKFDVEDFFLTIKRKHD
mmetsp:Transcript_8304/g.13884  ORF Transcript_8304/g.13884 Transcript_8304/m.13884 type:complete len:115 (+) Transcript_8304:312-656(+)